MVIRVYVPVFLENQLTAVCHYWSVIKNSKSQITRAAINTIFNIPKPSLGAFNPLIHFYATFQQMRTARHSR
ncbi:MAG: hypothetical protein WCA08_09585, partial [Desulfoferrobacter sp.]